MTAALAGDRRVVDLLLDAGADVHKADATGWTALICAAAGDISIVKRLIDADADAGHVARDGTTALKRASASDHVDVVELLEVDMRLRAELAWSIPRRPAHRKEEQRDAA